LKFGLLFGFKSHHNFINFKKLGGQSCGIYFYDGLLFCVPTCKIIVGPDMF